MASIKNIIILILLFCISIVCNAQLHIGMNTGFSIGEAKLSSGVPARTKDESKVVANSFIGLNAEYCLNKVVAIELECLYVTKNTRMKWDYTMSEGSRHYVRLRCIEIPFLLKGYLINTRFKVFVDAGVSVGFIQSITETDKFKRLEGVNQYQEKVAIHQTPVNNPSFAFNAGLGFLKKTGRVTFGFGNRYIHSINHDVYALKTVEHEREKTRYKGKDRQVRVYFVVAYVLSSDK